MLGAVIVDTEPFSIDRVQSSASADIAAKPVIASMKAHEFMGPGDETLTLTGQILPFHIGGLTQLDALKEMCRAGNRFPVMRGDGVTMGWYALKSVGEGHSELAADGVGYVVKHTLSLLKVHAEEAGARNTISGLLGLFAALG